MHELFYWLYICKVIKNIFLFLWERCKTWYRVHAVRTVLIFCIKFYLKMARVETLFQKGSKFIHLTGINYLYSQNALRHNRQTPYNYVGRSWAVLQICTSTDAAPSSLRFTYMITRRQAITQNYGRNKSTMQVMAHLNEGNIAPTAGAWTERREYRCVVIFWHGRVLPTVISGSGRHDGMD